MCVLVLFCKVISQPALGIQMTEKCYWTKTTSSGFSSDICTLRMSLSKCVTTTGEYHSYPNKYWSLLSPGFILLLKTHKLAIVHNNMPINESDKLHGSVIFGGE